MLIVSLALAGFFSGGAPVGAQETPNAAVPDTSTITTSVSQTFPQVSCTSSDALAIANTLQLAQDTRDQLSVLLKLGATWRFPVHIRVMTPDDPLTAKINREAAAYFSQGSTMKIEAVLPSSDPNAREFIQRQFVTAMLWEKFFANTPTFDKNTHLDVVPLWLVEGLREWLNRDNPERDREAIVKRAVQNKTSPTLDEVTGWHQLSDDRLLGIWQRAFCYYLVNCLVEEGPRRDDFQQWINGFSQPNPAQAQFHFPTEADWQSELVDASNRSNDIVYSWSDTASALEAAKTITYVSSKDRSVQSCNLDAIMSVPPNPIVGEALLERINVLTTLEIRAHPSWHSILELYRSALTALVKDYQPERAKQLFEEAHRRQVNEMAYHQQLLDYLNWFEVTKPIDDDTSHFSTYFSTAKEMEKIEADPLHPNPIRANLLQIESQL